MLGGQFQGKLFAFGWRTLVTERLPTFARTLFLPELTIPGLSVALIGAVWLLRRRLDVAAMLITGGVAIAVFALNYSVIDTPVFLIPSLLVAWLLAAVGAEHVVSWLPVRSWTTAGAALASLSIPVWLLVSNFAESDRSRDLQAGIVLDRLFGALPEHAALVREDFIADRMVLSKLLGEAFARTRQIDLAPAHPLELRGRLDSGPVYAFWKSAHRLRFDGLDVSFEPLPLIEGPIDQFLSRLADDAIVAVAVPGSHSGPFIAGGDASLSAIGGPSDLSVVAGLNLVLVGVRGRSGAAIQTGRLGMTLSVAKGSGIGTTARSAPSDIEVRADPFEAAIRQGGRELVRSTEGIALAVWKPDGHLADTFVLQAADQFRVPISAGALSAYKLRGDSMQARVAADSWSDLASSFGTGSVIVRVASGEKLALYVGDDAAMAPRVVDSRGRARVDVSSGATVAATRAVPELDARQIAQLDGDGKIYRIEIDAFGADVSVHLALGGIPLHAFGRVTRVAASNRADVFRVDTLGLLRRPDRRSEVLLMGRDAQAQLTGAGWSSVDRDAAGPFRWMTATEARLVLPVLGASGGHIRVQALRDEHCPVSTVGLRVNGADLRSQPLRAGWHVYEWDVPAGRIVPGANEVSVVVDRLSDVPAGRARAREIAIADVRLVHDES